MDEIERWYIRELQALQSVLVPSGTMPSHTMTYAEHRAQLIRDKLEELEAYRRKRDETQEKIYPAKRRRWLRNGNA